MAQQLGTQVGPHSFYPSKFNRPAAIPSSLHAAKGSAFGPVVQSTSSVLRTPTMLALSDDDGRPSPCSMVHA